MNYFYMWKRMCSLSFCSFAFTQEELQANLDLIQTYRLHIAQDINQDNLQLFLTSYNRYRILICLLDSVLFLCPSCSIDLLPYILFYWYFSVGSYVLSVALQLLSGAKLSLVPGWPFQTSLGLLSRHTANLPQIPFSGNGYWGSSSWHDTWHARVLEPACMIVFWMSWL